ncbi:MAG: hypothetical protein LBQ66_13735 [Planctomycetaceae bacterium]|jgi:YVTN family beta-propeller protein|nr:hypothetical protein [Planctomycetaceae bacterium]
MSNKRLDVFEFIVVLFVGIVIGAVLMFGVMSDVLHDAVANIVNPAPKTQFDFADKNNDNYVNKNEFEIFLAAAARNETDQFAQRNNESTLAHTVFVQSDRNRDGTISKKEFQNFLTAHARQQRDIIKQNQIAQNLNSVAAHTQNPTQQKVTNGEIFAAQKVAMRFKSPVELVSGVDGAVVFVVNRDADEVMLIDVVTDKILRTIPVGVEPSGIVLGQDGETMYVTSGGANGKLQAIDIATGAIKFDVAAGHTPMSPILSPDGERLFLCNRFSGDVAEYVVSDLRLVRRWRVVREPISLTIPPNGSQLFVANYQPNEPTNFPDNPNKPLKVAASVSVIDIETGTIKNIKLPNGSCMLQDICCSPDGNYVYVTQILSRFWNDTTKVDGGWMNANGICVIDTKNDFANTVLLDDPELGAANAWGIVMSPNGQSLWITIAGTDEVITIDREAMHKKLDTIRTNNTPIDTSNDLTFLTNIKQRIKLDGKGMRGIAVVGKYVYASSYFSDTVQKIDPESGAVVCIELGGGDMDLKRAGEMYWNDATLCKDQWQSCASCHPDARMTGMNWDLLHDGEGNPKNTKSLILSSDTPPTMWLGDRRHVMQCTRTGFRFIMFAPPQRDACLAIDEYLRELKPIQSPHLINGNLSEKAARGKIIFESAKTGCVDCHPAPHFTDLQMYDTGTKDQYSDQTTFDTPTLIEVWRTAPYLHDGRYANLKDIFKHGKHGKENGNIEQLTDSQLDDLVEYILSL